MPLEGCAMMAGLMNAISMILSGYAMFTGDWSCMPVSLVCSIIEILIVLFVLIMKHCH